MADVTIKIACGCGFSTSELSEAVKHVEKTGHTITSATIHIAPSK